MSAWRKVWVNTLIQEASEVPRLHMSASQSSSSRNLARPLIIIKTLGMLSLILLAGIFRIQKYVFCRILIQYRNHSGSRDRRTMMHAPLLLSYTSPRKLNRIRYEDDAHIIEPPSDSRPFHSFSTSYFLKPTCLFQLEETANSGRMAPRTPAYLFVTNGMDKGVCAHTPWYVMIRFIYIIDRFVYSHRLSVCLLPGHTPLSGPEPPPGASRSISITATPSAWR